MTFTHALSTNNYGPAKFIVSANAYEGTHTTIAAALTSASSGDTIFIRPGTYTENLTLKAGVNLTAYGSDSSLNATGVVIISGTCTMTTAGSVTINGIQLQTNSAALLAVTGSAASIVNITNCYLNCTNNTGITYSSSNAASGINIYNSNGNLGTTGIGYWTMTSAGNLTVNNFSGSNTGASTTATTSSAGAVFLRYCVFLCPFSVTSTGLVSSQFCFFDTSTQNVTAFTYSGGASSTAFSTIFSSGSASAISVTTNGLQITNSTVNSSNTNAVTGGGTIQNGGISFIGSSSLINTTTQTARNFDVGGISFDGGTNTLSTFTQGTFTPTILGSSTAGTSTYTFQVGRYQRVGRIVNTYICVATSGQTGTGNTNIAGLPFTTVNSATVLPPFYGYLGNTQTTTLPALGSFQAVAGINSTTITAIGVIVNTSGSASLKAIAATNDFILNGSYEV